MPFDGLKRPAETVTLNIIPPRSVALETALGQVQERGCRLAAP